MSAFEKWSVWVTSGATFLTGVIFLWMKYFLEPPDAWSVINHPLQPLVLKAHIVSAPLLVFAIGLISLRHVWRHYQSGVRLGRRSGLGVALLVMPMVFTGYLIQVVTDAGWVKAMVIGHIVTGLLYMVGLALHQLWVRRGGNGLPASSPLEAGWRATRPRTRTPS